MLRELAVRNLAVIEDVRVELLSGFCAWTGETGAGKSLLLGALGLLLGERGSAELIRAGAEELRVTGRFDLTTDQRSAVEAIAQANIEDDLIIARRLSRAGKSTALINDQPATVATLKRIGELLVDVHGQRDSYSLLQPAHQLALLDAYGKLETLRGKYETAAEKLSGLRREHVRLKEAKQSRQRELTLVRFEKDELSAANLCAGEAAKLDTERQKLAHAQSLAAFAQVLAARLYDDDGSVVEVLGTLLKSAQHWAKVDDTLKETAKRLESLRLEVQDLAEAARDRGESYAADPERLAEIESRLDLLAKLETKYAKDEAALVGYRDSLAERERILQKDESDFSTLEATMAPLVKELESAAKALSTKRAVAAKKLAAEVQSQLADLQMPKATLEIQFEKLTLGDQEIPAAGLDAIEILLSANPGEPLRPLRKVASGGELSRTMLALKTVLAAHDPVRTLVVFDEIDANVGGRLGDVLGKKLAALGKSHQVLCVTHLPQVAGFADRHWTIRKTSKAGRTSTTIAPLESQADRIEELAMMLRGESRSDSTRKEAAAMLRPGGRSAS